MSFLPNGYTEPTGQSNGGKYLKLPKDGSVRVRILSKTPQMGYEYWTASGKPRRLISVDGTPEDIRRDAEGKPEKIRFFWAVAVFNVDAGVVQIWNITQATIRRAIEALCQDEDYGDPIGYDLKISRKGEGLDTEYTVLPGKATPFTNKEAIQEAHAINWKAWMASEDPWKGDNWAREFWNLMGSVGWTKEQAAELLIYMKCVDSEGKPSTANLTEEHFNLALSEVGGDAPF